MENCAFVDIFTTQNDLYGSHQCPIQFCLEIFTNSEIYDDVFYSPKRRVMLNLIPDERIMMPGFVTSGISPTSVSSSDYNGFELKVGLERIYHILKSISDKGLYIIGYNHVNYDLRILNEHFVRILGDAPIVFDKKLMLDVMRMSERLVSITETGSYSMESMFAYLFGDIRRLSNIRLNKTTAAELRLTKMMFREIVKRVFQEKPELHSISEWTNLPLDASVMRFGKYKGLPLEKVFELDQKYLNWIRGNKDMKLSNPELVEAVERIFSEST